MFIVTKMTIDLYDEGTEAVDGSTYGEVLMISERSTDVIGMEALRHVSNSVPQLGS
jgi:hypothetical protein